MKVDVATSKSLPSLLDELRENVYINNLNLNI